MKTIVKYLSILFCTCAFFLFSFGCRSDGTSEISFSAEVCHTDENTVVIAVSEVKGEVKLIDCMKKVQSEGNLTYQIASGMISAINGKENTSSSYWMLYTSDVEMANTEWGTVEYDGNTYGSAILGVESLPVLSGATYIWSYQTFSL